MAPQPLGKADLARLYLFGILDNFWLARAVWVLFLLHRGFTLTEVALCEAALHLTAVALELPVGRLADRIGRKFTLAVGCICAMAASLLYLYAPSVPLLVLAFVCEGAASTFRSSSQEALFYDTCQAMDCQRDYPRLYGQFAAATMASVLVAEILGGVLSEWSFPAVFWIQIGSASLAALTIIGLREPNVGDRTLKASAARAGIASAIRLVLGRARLRMLFAYQAVFWTLVNVVLLYGQHLFSEQGASRSTIGLVYGLASLVGIVGAYRAYRWEPVLGERRSLLGALALAICGTIMIALLPAPVSYAGFALFYLAADYMEPVFSGYVNREIPSYCRATILSVFSVAMSLLTALVSPMIALLAEQVAVGHVLAVVAVVGGLVLLPGLRRWQAEVPQEKPEPSSIS